MRASGQQWGRKPPFSFLALVAAATGLGAGAPRAADESSCVERDALMRVSNAAQISTADLTRAVDDLRFVVPRSERALRAFDRVGAVSIRDKLTRGQWLKSGSGTLIDACHVLTSYHVVYPDYASRAFKPRASRRVAFSFGASTDGQRPFQHFVEGAVLDLGLFEPQRPIYAVDQVLIRLERSVPLAALRIADLPERDFGADVFACGYPGEVDIMHGAPQLLYCDRCQVKGYSHLRGYETNCTMLSGTSGGAVFRVVSDGNCTSGARMELIGAPNQSPGQEIFPKDHPRIRSFVSDFNKTLAAIERVIAAHPCEPPVLDAAPKLQLVMRGYSFQN